LHNINQKDFQTPIGLNKLAKEMVA